MYSASEWNENNSKWIFKEIPTQRIQLASKKETREWMKTQLNDIREEIDNGKISIDKTKELLHEMKDNRWSENENNAKYVLAIQAALHFLDYGRIVGAIDGMIGHKDPNSNTRLGIRAFQTDKNLRYVDSKPGPETITRLLRELNDRYNSPGTSTKKSKRGIPEIPKKDLPADPAKRKTVNKTQTKPTRVDLSRRPKNATTTVTPTKNKPNPQSVKKGSMPPSNYKPNKKLVNKLATILKKDPEIRTNTEKRTLRLAKNASEVIEAEVAFGQIYLGVLKTIQEELALPIKGGVLGAMMEVARNSFHGGSPLVKRLEAKGVTPAELNQIKAATIAKLKTPKLANDLKRIDGKYLETEAGHALAADLFMVALSGAMGNLSIPLARVALPWGRLVPGLNVNEVLRKADNNESVIYTELLKKSVDRLNRLYAEALEIVKKSLHTPEANLTNAEKAKIQELQQTLVDVLGFLGCQIDMQSGPRGKVTLKKTDLLQDDSFGFFESVFVDNKKYQKLNAKLNKLLDSNISDVEKANALNDIVCMLRDEMADDYNIDINGNLITQTSEQRVANGKKYNVLASKPIYMGHSGVRPPAQTGIVNYEEIHAKKITRPRKSSKKGSTTQKCEFELIKKYATETSDGQTIWHETIVATVDANGITPKNAQYYESGKPKYKKQAQQLFRIAKGHESEIMLLSKAGRGRFTAMRELDRMSEVFSVYAKNEARLLKIAKITGKEKHYEAALEFVLGEFSDFDELNSVFSVNDTSLKSAMKIYFQERKYQPTSALKKLIRLNGGALKRWTEKVKTTMRPVQYAKGVALDYPESSFYEHAYSIPITISIGGRGGGGEPSAPTKHQPIPTPEEPPIPVLPPTPVVATKVQTIATPGSF